MFDVVKFSFYVFTLFSLCSIAISSSGSVDSMTGILLLFSVVGFFYVQLEAYFLFVIELS